MVKERSPPPLRINSVATARVDADAASADEDRAHAVIPEAEDTNRDGTQLRDKLARSLRNGDGVTDPTRPIVRRERRFQLAVGNDGSDGFGRRRSDLNRKRCAGLIELNAAQHELGVSIS